MDKQQSDPSSRAHAKLSASQTKRWMSCPGSTTLIDALPALLMPRQSKFAALGTAAHSLIEECVNMQYDSCRAYKGYWIGQDGSVQRSKRDPEAFEVNDDMASAVDVMLRVVKDERDRLGPSAELRNEFRFDLSWLRPEMFGTNDVSLSLFLDELVVIDYKHGQGVPVEVSYRDADTGVHVGNTQLMYYALGAAHGYDFTHERVTLIVVQPRCPHSEGGVRRFTCTMAELLRFRDVLAEAVDRVHEATAAYGSLPAREWEDTNLRPGAHCRSSFCAMLATCPATHRLAEREAQADFSEEPSSASLVLPSTADGVSRALKWVPLLDARNKAISELAMRLAEQGIRVKGHKLVRKKANRTWASDHVGVRTALIAGGLSSADFMSKPELMTPAQVERIGPEAKAIVNGIRCVDRSDTWEIPPLAVKGVGGLTLAHEDDPRAEVVVDVSADFPPEV